MRKAPFIITLTGSSGCGKTYITDRIIEFGEKLDTEGVLFNPKRHWKYVTRSYRETEIIDKKLRNKGIDVKSVKTIPHDCEFYYSLYGNGYGFYKNGILDYLNKGESPIIVINDVSVVEDLKKEFPNQVLSLFLFREIIPNVETFKKSGHTRGGISESKIISRFEKAVVLYRVFIENISLFDRVILNVPNEEIKDNVKEFEYLAKIQAEGVIRGVIEEKISLNKKITKSPKLFIVSGNAQSGKDDIIRAAKNKGKLQTDILIKYTTRWEEDGDEGEIICKYIPKTILYKQYENAYLKKIDDHEKQYTFDKFNKIEKKKIHKEFKEKKDKYNTLKEFCEVKFEMKKLFERNIIKTGHECFWQAVQKDIENNQIQKGGSLNKKVLPENGYKEILNKYFDSNPLYLDLEEIVAQNVRKYEEEISKIDQRIVNKKENNSGCLQYKGKSFVLYENNKKLYGNPIYYGFEIDKYAEQLKKANKHIVLTASLPNIFNICREHFRKENVVTVYTYSQISRDEHMKISDGVMGASKLQEYDDILRYAYHIADFDYALIFAETSATNKYGNQKDELVDQMFRLFKVYNKEKIVTKNKLFVLSGASATGKSTILSKIAQDGLCKIAPKYSTREKRETIFDDIIPVPKEYIEDFCDEINYEKYGNRYGFNINNIKKGLNNSNLITICSDIDSIKKMKDNFSNANTIFIYLNDISVENLVKAYLERKKIKINNNELFLIAKNLSTIIKKSNKSEIKRLEKTFRKQMKELLTNIDFEEFDKRYLSLIYNNDDYDHNKYLIDHTISGENIDELTEECRKIIRTCI